MTGRPVRVRPRAPEDLPVLLGVLRSHHEREGYPVRAEAVSVAWLASEHELWAAVAADGDRPVGHVALHPADGVALPGWSAATGRPAQELAVVSRLYTDRTVRGAGVALLAAAVEAAAALGRVPVLQVDPDSPARAFYGRRGWREVGVARQSWGHRTVDAVLLTAPSG